MEPPTESSQDRRPGHDGSGPPSGSVVVPGGSPVQGREPALAGGRHTDASLYLHPRTLARLKSFELRAKMIIEGIAAGAHRSPYRGVSVEFAQHRPYAAGDDLRHLDWKVFARTDRLQVKQYEQETNLDLVLLVDSSGSMDFGTRSFEEASGVGRKMSPDGRTNWTKYDHATALSAALAAVTLRQGDRVGLVVFADDARSVVERSGQNAAWRKLVASLSTEPVDRPTDLRRAVDRALSLVRARSLFAIVSDFFADLDEIRGALARLRHRQHDVMCFQVMDRAEIAFDLEDPRQFVGAEGEEPIRVDPRAMRRAYLEALEAHTDGLFRMCRGFGFDVHRLSTHDWLGPALAEFIARRASRLKRGSA